jgi:hypothetical protein
LLSLGLGLAARVAPARVPELADRLLTHLPPESSGALSAWTHLAGYHLARGDVAAALEGAQTAITNATALGERSALVPMIAAHALALQELGCVEEAARVRGATPRRWTVYFQHLREELDTWLAEHLPADRLEALAAEGRSMTLDELFSIAPAALAAAQRIEDVSSPRPSTGS